MAKIPLPERGQPIDVSYIAQITNAVNELSDQIVTTGYNFSTINGRDIQTSNLRIVAGSVVVSPGTAQTADRTVTFNFDYNLNFQTAPVATATILNTNRTDAGDAATVMLTNVNANGLQGLVRFQKTGNVNAEVQIIVVGIPTLS
jgi:hypothetical protein